MQKNNNVMQKELECVKSKKLKTEEIKNMYLEIKKDFYREVVDAKCENLVLTRKIEITTKEKKTLKDNINKLKVKCEN